MHWIDWTITLCLAAGIILLAVLVSGLTKSVSDFLVANRSAGRYLLTMASGMSGLGAINMAANFEKYYHAGFGALWWGQMFGPIMMVLALTGFVIYRYRETRAMTMAQFFEMRYSRKFRVFAGMLAWTSGILNYGVFPGITARFIVHFTGMPDTVLIGSLHVPTIAPVMLVMLGLALFLAMSGGQIAVMITDFVQGQFVAITVLVIIGILFSQLSWDGLIEGLKATPVGQSRISPFDQGKVQDFNVWFFAMWIGLNVYGYQAWQGSQGYNAAAKTPHEARMAKVLGEFRGMVITLLMMLIPVFMYAILNGAGFESVKAATEASISKIADPQIQEQMLVPIALSNVLPVGVMGMFAAVIFAAALSTDDTYLHSWGSIFIQDVIVPLRGDKYLKPRTHLRLLRLSMLFVAVFAFFFSMLFPLRDYILMYFRLTGAIYIGGAGSAIIGGLYWKRGTAGGAWAGVITGGVLSVGGLVLQNLIWPRIPEWKTAYPALKWIQPLPDAFPLNGMEMGFLCSVLACLAYVGCSLLSPKAPADMDKLLHRGKYAKPEDQIPLPLKPGRVGWLRFLGVNKNFTRGDKAIFIFKISWTLFFFAAFIIGTIINVLWSVSTDSWVHWWRFQVTFTTTVAIIVVVWFLIGGIRDLRDLIKTLRTVARDANDDGTVSDQEHVQN